MTDLALEHDGAPDTELIHGVFNRQDVVFAGFRARCAGKGIDLGKFSWLGSEQAPEFDPDDPETVVVLGATLDTLQNTLEFVVEWYHDVLWARKNSWMTEDREGLMDLSRQRWMKLLGKGKFRLLSDERESYIEGDGPDFVPWTLHWVRIKLDTHLGDKPIDVRDPKSSPGSALFFMGAEHPKRIEATDFEKRFGFWVPGLKAFSSAELRLAKKKLWLLVPWVQFWGAGLGSLPPEFGHEINTFSHWGLANPTFRE